MVVWKDFPARVAHDFDWLAEQARLFRAVSFPGTIAYLPTRDKADFFTSLKGSRRHNLKKKIRKSVEKASLAAETVRAPDATTLDRIFDLFTQTYQKSDQKFEKLTRKFFDVISEQASVFYLLLRERSSRDIVAFMLCFDMKPILVNKFIGLDYSRPRDWNLYFRLWDATLDLAAEHGYSAIESGQLAYPVKIEMGHRLQALNNYCFHRNPFMHRIYALATRATVSWYTLDDGLSRHLKAHPETLHELQNTGRASEVRWVAEPQPDEQPVTTQSVYY
jgi:hypothetical protein